MKYSLSHASLWIHSLHASETLDEREFYTSSSLHNFGDSVCRGRSNGTDKSSLESTEEWAASSEAAFDIAKKEECGKRDHDRCEHCVVSSANEHVGHEWDQPADNVGERYCESTLQGSSRVRLLESKLKPELNNYDQLNTIYLE